MRPRSRSRLRRIADIAIPLLVGLFLVLVALGPPDEDPPWTLVGIVVGAGQAAALCWRRSHPLEVLAITLAGGFVVWLMTPDVVFPVAALFAIGSVAAARPPLVWLVALMALLGLTALNYITSPAEDATFAMLLPDVAWALGEAARNRRLAIEQASIRAVSDEQARTRASCTT